MSSLKSIEDQIREFEEELKKTPYNKRTQHHIGLVKAKIARLKERIEVRKSSKKKGEGYTIQKSGDVTAVLLGFPSVGKSTILNALTNANSQVGDYDFTTLDVIPGLMEYKYAKIQILDVPGIVKGAASGRGRGKEVLSVIRSADLIIMIIDAKQPVQSKVIMKEIYDSNIRINQRRPDVRIRKTAKNGVRVGATVKLDIDEQTIKNILKEFKIMNAEVLIRDKVDIDKFIDIVEKNKVYIPAITVVNKIDLANNSEIERVKKLNPDIMISAEKKEGLDKLKELIFNKLGLMSIYLKEPGKEADMKEPLIIRNDSTLKDLCIKLHKDFVDKFKFARIWGRSVKFPGQKLLKLAHKLKEGDIVEVHLR